MNCVHVFSICDRGESLVLLYYKPCGYVCHGDVVLAYYVNMYVGHVVVLQTR